MKVAEIINMIIKSKKTKLVIEALETDIEMCVGSITAETNLSQPEVSQVLAKLLPYGFVSKRKEGTFRYYRLNREKMDVFNGMIRNMEYFLTK